MPKSSCHKLPCVLSIAGSDSSAGAGIQADLKTAADFGVYCATAITAITAQNTTGVKQVAPVAPEMIKAQIDAVVSDLNVMAIKIGLVPTPEAVKVIAEAISGLKDVPVVIDPVMTSSSGHDMSVASTAMAMKTFLFPRAEIVTPNIPEMLALLGRGDYTDEKNLMNDFLATFGSGAVCLKGGHGDGAIAIDRLMMAGSDEVFEYGHPRIDTKNSHGTGCTFSTAIACGLVSGWSVPHAVAEASKYVYSALLEAKDVCVGDGTGPMMHNVKRTILTNYESDI